MARTLGLRPEAGLIEYLAGQASLDEVLVTDESSDNGRASDHSRGRQRPDLLGSESMRILLEKLKTDYDLVLVDSLPLLLVSDARVLGEICDKLVFVVRWEQAPRQVEPRAPSLRSEIVCARSCDPIACPGTRRRSIPSRQ